MWFVGLLYPAKFASGLVGVVAVGWISLTITFWASYLLVLAWVLFPSILTSRYPSVIATLSNAAFPVVEKANVVSQLPLEAELIFKLGFILGFGASILGVTGGLIVVGSKAGSPLRSTFKAKLAFLANGVIGFSAAAIGIAALGSIGNVISVEPP